MSQKMLFIIIWNVVRLFAVCEAEEHDLWLKESTVHVEGCFPLIPFTKPNIVEAPEDLSLSEVLHAMELCDQFGDEWNWLLVLDCDCIQGSVVLYELEQAILPLDEEDWRCHGQL